MTKTVSLLLLLAVAGFPNTSRAAAGDGQVTLPLTMWAKLLTQLTPEDRPQSAPPARTALIERTIDGTFRKGLLRATLVARFTVLDGGGHVRVPILADDASPSRVSLNGKPTSLVKRDGMYTVGVDKPGTYEVKVTFYRGEEQDRFARRLHVGLPPGGVTRIAISVPERNIVAQLDRGMITAHKARPRSTLLKGYLDASGSLDLSWNRRITHEGKTSTKLLARINALLTVRETLIDGVAVFDFDVLDGETDRFDLLVPDDIEITKVTGDAVLQWRSDASKLTVLLRHLVEERSRVSVHFQYAADIATPISLRMPLPPTTVAMTGVVGVQGPAGLQIEVANVAKALALSPRDLPSELTDLTGDPLLFGFSFTEAPAITLSASRLKQVTLTSTLIDEIEASTVLVEDGTEITKMKLYIRNNTRQYLQIRLREDEVLTHALIDGHPVRPAIAANEHGQALLFSLRQSERIDPEVGRIHQVRNGETLGQIAIAYYADPSKWTLIQDEDGYALPDDASILVGQKLRIPSAGPITVEESSFVLELAYRRRNDRMGMFGSTQLALPELDVEAMKVTWHVYLPKAIAALRFDANLTQYSRIRYGTLRRFLNFLDEALGGRKAWAGTSKYESILSKRRSIYHNEVERKGLGEVSPARFPLVGERHRFKRILVDREQPRVTVIYGSKPLLKAVRWIALVAAFALALMVLRSNRRWWHWTMAALGVAGLLIVGHYVLGVHRRAVWGFDLALVVALVRMRGSWPGTTVSRIVWSPWEAVRLLTWGNLYVVVALAAFLHFIVKYPLLMSSVVLLVLLVLWQRKSRSVTLSHAPGEEVDHVAA